MKKLNDFFNFSMKALTKSLEENLPEEHNSEPLKINVTFEYTPGHHHQFGLCRCRDEHGNWKWMDCDDCQH